MNTEINDIIIASEKVKKAKAKGNKLTPKEKKEISEEEKNTNQAEDDSGETN